jgi:hypothetical protein
MPEGMIVKMIASLKPLLKCFQKRMRQTIGESSLSDFGDSLAKM